MKVRNILEAIPVKMPPQTPEQIAGRAGQAMLEASRACKSILEGKPVLYRGVRSHSFADEVFALPYGYSLQMYGPRVKDRNSATGNNLVQSLTRLHPDWIKTDLPNRKLSVFCANLSHDAQEFGYSGIVLPFNSVNVFGVADEDLNLKKVITNADGDHHLLRLQNAVVAFLIGIDDLITLYRAVLRKKGPAIGDAKLQYGLEHLTDAEFCNRILGQKLIKAIANVTIDWIKQVGGHTHSWTQEDLNNIDDLYKAYLETKHDSLVQRLLPDFATYKMQSVFQDNVPSEVFHRAMTPENLGILSCSYDEMLKQIASPDLKEIWFEGPHFMITSEDSEADGKDILAFLSGNKIMQTILKYVAGQ